MDPTQEKRDVDQWLEAALSDYGKSEPRIGLESRVVATLAGERTRMASRRRWWWAVGTAALAAVLVTVWIGRTAREKNRGNALAPPPSARRQAARDDQARRSTPPAPAPQLAHVAKRVANRGSADPPASNLGATPKLERFPSPQPLSEQEQILASYVAKYPESAALVAEARMKALQRDREEEAQADSPESAR